MWHKIIYIGALFSELEYYTYYICIDEMKFDSTIIAIAAFRITKDGRGLCPLELHFSSNWKEAPLEQVDLDLIQKLKLETL